MKGKELKCCPFYIFTDGYHEKKRHVKNYQSSEMLRSTTLYTYPDPVSPHIATDSVRLKIIERAIKFPLTVILFFLASA